MLRGLLDVYRSMLPSEAGGQCENPILVPKQVSNGLLGYVNMQ